MLFSMLKLSVKFGLGVFPGSASGLTTWVIGPRDAEARLREALSVTAIFEPSTTVATPVLRSIVSLLRSKYEGKTISALAKSMVGRRVGSMRMVCRASPIDKLSLPGMC